MAAAHGRNNFLLRVQVNSISMRLLTYRFVSLRLRIETIFTAHRTRYNDTIQSVSQSPAKERTNEQASKQSVSRSVGPSDSESTERTHASRMHARTDHGWCCMYIHSCRISYQLRRNLACGLLAHNGPAGLRWRVLPARTSSRFRPTSLGCGSSLGRSNASALLLKLVCCL